MKYGSGSRSISRSRLRNGKECRYAAQSYLWFFAVKNPPYDILYNNINDTRQLLPIYYDSSFHNEDEGEAICGCDDIAYLPGYTEPNYLIVMAIPLDDNSKTIGTSLILGKSEQVYASVENLYITSTSYKSSTSKSV